MMEQYVVVNNCGEYLKKEKSELQRILLKKATEIWYRSRPRRFNAELDILLLYLECAESIQIYKTGVARIFLKHDYFEKRMYIFLKKLPESILEILCE